MFVLQSKSVTIFQWNHERYKKFHSVARLSTTLSSYLLLSSVLRFARDFDKVHVTMIGYTIKFKLLLRRQRSWFFAFFPRLCNWWGKKQSVPPVLVVEIKAPKYFVLCCSTVLTSTWYLKILPSRWKLVALKCIVTHGSTICLSE